MGKVNILDRHTAELIAAGEVIERPASVVKELVENSIDAGAKNLVVELKNGGVTLIKITDSGEGISREDVPKAFLRHATSKMKSENDLFQISTLGFRGEALASISAVSRVEVITRTAQEMAGTRYIIEGGEEILCEDIGCSVGTTIFVRDIFFNTPARMKFLKKDVSEANAVAALLDRIALSHPEISVNFIRDGKEEMSTPGNGDLKACIYAVHGKQFSDSLIPVEYSVNALGVKGFISQPHNARANRSMQHFFINGRYVRSKTMQVALEEACRKSVMAGKFPSCVLNLDIPFEAVDVNVHPSKTEVRFENERTVFDVVYYGVKTALNAGGEPPSIEFKEIKPAAQSVFVPAAPIMRETAAPKAPEVKIKEEENVDIPLSRLSPPPINRGSRFSDSGFEYKTIEINNTVQNTTIETEKPIQTEMIPAEEKTNVIGEAFDTYVLVQRGDTLFLIDKHAAHERILYEELNSDCDDTQMQNLLSPITVRLDKNDYNSLINNLNIAAEAGFDIEDFGAGTVIVRAVPMMLAGTDIEGAVQEISGYLSQNRKNIRTEHLEWIFHSVACRAAIKAGDESSFEEIASLALKLENNPDIKHCPHGRPVTISLSKREIEKKFGRV